MMNKKELNVEEMEQVNGGLMHYQVNTGSISLADTVENQEEQLTLENVGVPPIIINN